MPANTTPNQQIEHLVLLARVTFSYNHSMDIFSAPLPFSLILFGASGHLARIKLFPALYVLALKKRLPKEYAIVGFSRTEMETTAFRMFVEKAVREHMLEVNESVLGEFLSHVYYCTGQYTNLASFSSLKEQLLQIEKGWKNQVRLAYYSVPPNLFSSIAHNLCESGIRSETSPVRSIVEKPVGHDRESFEEIREKFLSCSREEDLYLLDHYLGKEAVRNIFYLRYANPIVERIFKNTLIHHVEITAFEEKGLEGRAGYFEHTGTLRDMFQSHLLMIGSLLTMRLTEKDESVVHNRAKALEQFYLPSTAKLGEIVLQGQYTAGTVHGESVLGYREEEGISATSRTNTFACLKLMTRSSRWDGVPFYLRSGKRLAKKETRISIVFQEPHPIGKGAEPNRLEFILQGEAGMRITLQTKLGGTVPAFRPLILTDPLVCVGDCLPEHSLLLLEAIHGKRQWFLTFEEVRCAWRLMDPLQAYLSAPDTPLYTYPAGSRGPEEADAWIERDSIAWISS